MPVQQITYSSHLTVDNTNCVLNLFVPSVYCCAAVVRHTVSVIFDHASVQSMDLVPRASAEEGRELDTLRQQVGKQNEGSIRVAKLVEK